jgi:hypothetical protein
MLDLDLVHSVDEVRRTGSGAADYKGAPETHIVLHSWPVARQGTGADTLSAIHDATADHARIFRDPRAHAEIRETFVGVMAKHPARNAHADGLSTACLPSDRVIPD